MDLGAYVQIPKLSDVAKANGINIPRLRGYRLMVAEEPMAAHEIEAVVEMRIMEVYENACVSEPKFHPNSGITKYTASTQRTEKKYLIKMKTANSPIEDPSDVTVETVGFRWNLLHGKQRKRLKFAVKKAKRAVKRQYEVFNKYAGGDGVLLIHARIGGPNWVAYGGPDLEKQPWFIEKVDDAFDRTYCDIYAKIDTEATPA